VVAGLIRLEGYTYALPTAVEISSRSKEVFMNFTFKQKRCFDGF
jgi:hypothetical protein